MIAVSRHQRRGRRRRVSRRMMQQARELEALVLRASAAAQPAYRRAVASAIEGDNSAEDWLRFREVMFRSLMFAALQGRKSVWDDARALMPEGFDMGDQDIPEDVGEVSRFARDEVAPGVEQLLKPGPFVAALKFFQGTVPRLRSEIDAIRLQLESLTDMLVTRESAGVVEYLSGRSAALQQSLRVGFWVSDVDKATVINLRSLIGRSVRVGSDRMDVAPLGLPDFLDEAKIRGAANLTDARLETVFRTNVNRSYNEGSASVLKTPAARVIMPLVEIINPCDPRSRPTHCDFSGFIGTIDDLERAGLIPPLGFQCRCTTRALSRIESKRRGLLDDRGAIDHAAVAGHNGSRAGLVSSGAIPDPGFG